MSEEVLTVAELERLLADCEAVNPRTDAWSCVVYEQPEGHAFPARAGYYAAGPSSESKGQAHADARFFELARGQFARVCRHALALEAEVARLQQLRLGAANEAQDCRDENTRLRRLIEGQRHEVHEDDGDA
jgi:hypothetical protein